MTWRELQLRKLSLYIQTFAKGIYEMGTELTLNSLSFPKQSSNN